MQVLQRSHLKGSFSFRFVSFSHSSIHQIHAGINKGSHISSFEELMDWRDWIGLDWIGWIGLVGGLD